MSDLNQNTLTQITNLIKTKKISSLEVTKFFIKNIEKAKKLNSFITTCFEKSLHFYQVSFLVFLLLSYHH